ncbi:MAG: putative hydro-lyase [Chloroflexi bacterium]|nr:putative hydro-lyase [Chloroflexota bacterium]
MSVNNYPDGRAARSAMRSGDLKTPTAGLAPGYVQANLVILPQQYAFDFLQFCVLNPKPCPILDVTEPGSYQPSREWADGADLRTDLPRYRIYRNGEITAEPEDIREYWQTDLVSFLIGCSFTFEEALLAGGVPVRHIECGCNVPMYKTNVDCKPAGVFRGPLVVSMRPIPASLVSRAVQITSRFPAVHGAPVHIGDPGSLGIMDLDHPDYGDSVPVLPGEVPVFWACGVTPQAAAQAVRLPLMITHAPGHMFITDRLNAELATG